MRIHYFSLMVGALIIVITGCQKESIVPEKHLSSEKYSTELRASESGKVALCHLTGKHGYEIIFVNENAVSGHLKHGDFQLIDNDGDGYYSNDAPCIEIKDCNDADHEVTAGQSCTESDCCFCYFVEDIPWQIYLNIPEEAGFPVKGTQLLLGNPASGGFTIQVVYNINIPNGWECTFVNADFPTGVLFPITAEQAMSCRNVLCQIASNLDLANIFGAQASENETRSQQEFEFFKMGKSKL